MAMLNFDFIDKVFSVIQKYPVGIIVMLFGLGFIFNCIKEKCWLSALVMGVQSGLLMLGMFTNILTNILINVPLIVQYIGLIIFTILCCVVYDYETSKD
ncbi:hypothetical protein [Bacillus multifaciens]|uniref:hypothetical protein n=1 Tax=Bacillus multifaciens TaxID=3068506 RepID=UPI0027403C55|nr:hypothetical protein [Bacillus sp. WLY-B-L8]